MKRTKFKPRAKTQSRPAKDIPGVIQAHSFQLVDKKGKRRAELVEEEGWAILRLLDKQGMWRVELCVDPRGLPSLALFDKDGQDRLTLHLDSDGSSSMGLSDKYGKPCADLSADQRGAPALDLWHRSGEIHAGWKDGPIEIKIRAKNGDNRVLYNVENGSIEIFDKKGKFVWSLP